MNRKGFTLIELLIVVVIIGILAAIAIPKFASTKEKAYLASMKTDLRNLATAQEAYAADNNQNYFTAYAQQFGINAATSDIFGCAGVLAADPTNCAALNRHVRQLDPSQYSNPAAYYQAAPANYYAKFWHDNAINGLAYGFPYDDYAGQSSFISHGSPQWLDVAVGF